MTVEDDPVVEDSARVEDEERIEDFVLVLVFVSEPHLRMLHLLNVQPSGWIKVPASKYRLNNEHLLSDTTLDLQTSWDSMRASPVSSLPTA